MIGGSGTTDGRQFVRLNSDGSIDPSFNTGTGPNSSVFSVAHQPDGKILVGGDFTRYNGVTRNRVVRINGDGSLDTSFDPGSGANGFVLSVVSQPDGKILLKGGFAAVGGTSRSEIARLNSNGTLDASFNPGTGLTGSLPVADIPTATLALQPDMKIIVVGRLTHYNGVPRRGIARVNSDGSLDSTFNPGAG